MRFETEGTLGRATAAGELEPEAASDLATVALARAAAARLSTLLVDFRELRLKRPLSVAESYALGKHLARAGGGLSKVAFLVASGCAEPNSFALAVAGNRGLPAASFQDEERALRWLER